MASRRVLKADLVVIGGGPGGYAAAVRGAQLGGDVVLVEEKRLGGVCVNVGCIPSKMLLHSAGLLSRVRGAEVLGVRVSGAALDLNRLMGRKRVVIDGMVGEMERVLEGNGVQILYGRGRLVSPGVVEVEGSEGVFSVESRAIIIATGSRPAVLPIRGLEYAVTTERLVELGELPDRVVMLGGGPEGVEFATLLNDLGVEVTVVEVMDILIPLEDHELGRRLEEILRRRGVEVRVKTDIRGISAEDGVKIVSIRGVEGVEDLEADMVVLASGRVPNSEKLGLEGLSVAVRDGWIVVDRRMATNVAGVYAVGDVVGGGLAHVASAQGVVAAENALGLDSTYDGQVVPRCLYTRPEVAAVGLTEEEARAEGLNLKIGRSDMAGNARAAIIGETTGFAKILVDATSGRVLGVHLMGEHASEIIPEASLAMRLNATAADIASTIHLYPTISEALREAALDVEDSYSSS